MKVEKGTHEEYRTDLFMPIMKSNSGKYIAVLSDDSVDRDDEKLSRSCIEKLGQDDSYLAALCNHDNNVFMQVAEWVNKGVTEVDGYTALIAEPRFFVKSSPQARQIKGMLDEGAKIGISIGAMVKNYDEIDGRRVYTELELVEASFVAVPSNRHGRAMAVAKSFNGTTKTMEESKMEKEFTQKDVDAVLEKKVEEMKLDFTKQLETKEAEITKLKEDLKKSDEDSEAAKAELAEKVEEAEAKVEEAEKALKATKQEALEKANFTKAAELKENMENVDKSLSEGKLPFVRL